MCVNGVLPPGISLKTQELYLLVFVTRYLDLFTADHFSTFLHFYVTVFKVCVCVCVRVPLPV